MTFQYSVLDTIATVLDKFISINSNVTVIITKPSCAA